jgi:hypothetical protein
LSQMWHTWLFMGFSDVRMDTHLTKWVFVSTTIRRMNILDLQSQGGCIGKV